jgi:hypothetical protein
MFDLIAIKIISIADRQQIQFWIAVEVASLTQTSLWDANFIFLQT